MVDARRSINGASVPLSIPHQRQPGRIHARYLPQRARYAPRFDILRQPNITMRGFLAMLYSSSMDERLR